MAADVEFNVKVRQVYKDCDERSGRERWLTVLGVDEREGIASCSTMSRVIGLGTELVPGRATTVKLKRLRPGSTGYRLVSAVGAYE